MVEEIKSQQYFFMEWTISWCRLNFTKGNKMKMQNIANLFPSLFSMKWWLNKALRVKIISRIVMRTSINPCVLLFDENDTSVGYIAYLPSHDIVTGWCIDVVISVWFLNWLALVDCNTHKKKIPSKRNTISWMKVLKWDFRRKTIIFFKYKKNMRKIMPMVQCLLFRISWNCTQAIFFVIIRHRRVSMRQENSSFVW